MTNINLAILCLVAIGGPMAGGENKALLLSEGNTQNEIPEQYIAVFKAGSPKNIPEISGINILRSYTVGQRRFALVSSPVNELDALLSHPTLEFLEANRWLHVEDPIDGVAPLNPPIGKETQRRGGKPVSRDFEMCNMDWHNPASNAWGIIRTSYRDMPSYLGWGSPYVYGTNDAGDGVDIYILDTGIYLEHTDFEGRASFGMVADGVDEAGDIDLHGHGTHVAGTAAGRRFGVARKAKLISCKVFNGTGIGGNDGIIQAIEWIVNKVKQQRSQGRATRPIINMSLGGLGFDYAGETAIQEAIEEGITVVTSAGNSEEDACVYTPARVSSVVTVGATDRTDSMASFSNYGPCVDILAPGASIAGPHMNGTFGQENPYVLLSGTSMASPHVAGIIARYLSTFSHTEIESVTPGLIKAMINDRATNRLISYEGLAKWPTPNKLLYRGCGDGDETHVPPPSTTTTSTTTTPSSTTTPTPATNTTSFQTSSSNSGENFTESIGLLHGNGERHLFLDQRSASDSDSPADDTNWTVMTLTPLVTGSLVLMSVTFGANIGTVVVFWILLRRQRDATPPNSTSTGSKNDVGYNHESWSNKL